MENLLKYVRAAVGELDAWDGEAPLGCSPEFRGTCRTLLLRATDASNVEELEEQLALISRLIADSGPSRTDFLPSLNLVGVALHKRSTR